MQSGAGPGGGALTVASHRTSNTTATFQVPAGAAGVLVAACNGNGCSNYGPASNINPPGPNPTAPSLAEPIPGTTVTGPVVTFTWPRVPGDNGTNTLYRLYIGDLAGNRPALDVITRDNFYGAQLSAEGRRYDGLLIVNPGASQVQGGATPFQVTGNPPSTPQPVFPTHNGTVQQGNVQLLWTSLPNATIYQYYVIPTNQPAQITTGVTSGQFVQVPMFALGGQNTAYSAIIRACFSAVCVLGNDAGWGPWSGALQYIVTP
ncbi:MAG: hypothetical protein FJW39_28885 [Acidobacteria bacterium]|nr:hypothetical protein [Acidobacteriota bacterium]